MSSLVFTELHTDRLRLRKLLDTDWPVISFLRSDGEVNKYVDRSSAETEDEALAFITRISNAVDNGESFYWAICLKDSSEMVGSICLWNFSEDKKHAEVGYDLHPNYHGKGVMTESLRALLDFAFNQLQLHCVEAYTHYKNLSSIKLLERHGFNKVQGKTDVDNSDNVVYSRCRSNEE